MSHEISRAGPCPVWFDPTEEPPEHQKDHEGEPAASHNRTIAAVRGVGDLASSVSRSRMPTVPSLSKSGGQPVAHGGGKQVPQALPPATEHQLASSLPMSNASTHPSDTPSTGPEMSARAKFGEVQPSRRAGLRRRAGLGRAQRSTTPRAWPRGQRRQRSRQAHRPVAR